MLQELHLVLVGLEFLQVVLVVGLVLAVLIEFGYVCIISDHVLCLHQVVLHVVWVDHFPQLALTDPVADDIGQIFHLDVLLVDQHLLIRDQLLSDYGLLFPELVVLAEQVSAVRIDLLQLLLLQDFILDFIASDEIIG